MHNKKNKIISNFNNNKHFNNNHDNNIVYKKEHPQYHNSSTLYTYTPRSVLERIEKEFQFPSSNHEPKTIGDHFALHLVRSLKKVSEIIFEEHHINYSILLESIASVPGLCGGAILHLRALRTLESSNWIKTLMDESENERIHLMVFIELAKSSIFERILISISQFIVFIFYIIGYSISPGTMHRIVGYLEYEAVNSYSKFLADIDSGIVENIPASKLAIEYWGLPKDATLRDMILVIRQDEVDHNIINHEISTKILNNNNDPITIAIENKFINPQVNSTHHDQSNNNHKQIKNNNKNQNKDNSNNNNNNKKTPTKTRAINKKKNNNNNNTKINSIRLSSPDLKY